MGWWLPFNIWFNRITHQTDSLHWRYCGPHLEHMQVVEGGCNANDPLSCQHAWTLSSHRERSVVRLNCYRGYVICDYYFNWSLWFGHTPNTLPLVLYITSIEVQTLTISLLTFTTTTSDNDRHCTYLVNMYTIQLLINLCEYCLFNFTYVDSFENMFTQLGIWVTRSHRRATMHATGHKAIHAM